MEEWYKLDNVAKVYPAIRTKKWESIFRISALLKNDIKVPVLERALQNVLPRFPVFSTRLRYGFFWFYLDKNKGELHVTPDSRYPCRSLREGAHFPLRVTYYKKRLAIEVFHALCDGAGGMAFFNTLLTEYLRLTGTHVVYGGDAFDPSSKPRIEETQDAYSQHLSKGRYSAPQSGPSYRLRGTPRPDFTMLTMTGLIKVSDIKKLSGALNVSINDYLAGLLLWSLGELQKESKDLKPVRLNVPVDLRRFFKTESLRNFTALLMPELQTGSGDYTLEEAVLKVHYKMRLDADSRTLGCQFTNNVRLERFPIMRAMPLPIKNAAINMVFRLLGDNRTTMTFSNLGVQKLPYDAPVQRMDVNLSPSEARKISATCVTFGETLSFTFSQVIEETTLARIFFTKLVKMGVPVKLESNH